MSRALQTLLWTLDVTPELAVGHSAGAAILVRMTADAQLRPRALVALNGALLPLAGPAGQLFSPLAKLLAGLPGLPDLFAWRARDPKVVQRLLDATGSTIAPEGAALYRRLVQDRRHAAAALAMMAHWDLVPLAAEFPRLAPPFILIAGSNDRTVPPSQSERVAALAPNGRLVLMPALGHLAHEEQPGPTATLIADFAREHGII